MEKKEEQVKEDIRKIEAIEELVLQFGLMCYNDGFLDGSNNIMTSESIVQKLEVFKGYMRY